MQTSTLWRLGLIATLAQFVLLSLPLGPFPFDDEGTSRLSVHLLFELVAITIGIMVVTVSWHTHDERPDPALATLVGGLSFVVVCDVMHTLVYKGMPPFLGESASQRAIYFWLLGRTAEWLTLLLAVSGRGPRQRGTALAAGLGLGLLAVVHGSTGTWGMPLFLEPGKGLTAAKVVWEWALCLANVALAVHLWRRAAGEASPTEAYRLRLFATSAWVMGIGELAFTAYQSPSDFINIVGHVFKVIAYGLLYLSAYAIALKAPFDALRRSRAEAVEAGARVRLLTENLPSSALCQWRETPEGEWRLEGAGESFTRVTGLPVQADRAAFLAAIAETEREGFVAALGEAAREARELVRIVPWRREGGRPQWLRVSATPRRPAPLELLWDMLLTDVTAERLAEEAQRQRDGLFAAVVEGASDAVVCTDAHGLVTLFNPAAQRIFGRTEAQMLGQPVDRLLPAPPLDAGVPVAPAGAGVPPAVARFAAPRVTARRPDGGPLVLEGAVSRVSVADRSVYTLMLRDISGRVRAEREAQAHQAALTDLTQRLMAQERETTRRLAQLMHDQLGQTLAAMRIDFVGEARWADPEYAARHARVDRLIDQAVREVRQLLVELRPTLLDDQGVAAALDNEVRVRRQQPQTPAIVLELGEGVGALRWPTEVEYAVFMIAREALGNAVRHAGAGRIVLRLEGGPEHLRLQVEDDGRGLQEPAPSERVGHLGLVGMRERAVAIGARLDIGSAPGAGTTVALRWGAAAPV